MSPCNFITSMVVRGIVSGRSRNSLCRHAGLSAHFITQKVPATSNDNINLALATAVLHDSSPASWIECASKPESAPMSNELAVTNEVLGSSLPHIDQKFLSPFNDTKLELRNIDES